MSVKDFEFWKENIKKDVEQPLSYKVGCLKALISNLEMTQEQILELMQILFN